MNIDWGAFTPWTSLAGGALIGLSALLFLLANGRIAGISGVLGGLLSPGGDGRHWRVAFVLGLVLAPLFWRLAADLPPLVVDADWPLLIGAGLLVGIRCSCRPEPNACVQFIDRQDGWQFPGGTPILLAQPCLDLGRKRRHVRAARHLGLEHAHHLAHVAHGFGAGGGHGVIDKLIDLGFVELFRQVVGQ